MNRLCLFLLSAAVLAGTRPLHAAPAADFDAANRAFGSGKLPEAIAQYEKITKTNGYSASVLFNLGNAYYRNGQLGRAILNYERAERLSPRDPDIKANLKSARTQASLPQPDQRWWQAALQSLTPSQWAYLASFCFVLLCLLTMARLLHPEWIQRLGVSEKYSAPAWRLVQIITGLTLFLSAASSAASTQDRPEAVVIAKEAALLSSPFDKSESIATLPEGESVNAEKKYGNYILVRYEKGKSGWVSQSQIDTVDPYLLTQAP